MNKVARISELTPGTLQLNMLPDVQSTPAQSAPRTPNVYMEAISLGKSQPLRYAAKE